MKTFPPPLISGVRLVSSRLSVDARLPLSLALAYQTNYINP